MTLQSLLALSRCCHLRETHVSMAQRASFSEIYSTSLGGEGVVVWVDHASQNHVYFTNSHTMHQSHDAFPTTL